MTENDKQDIIIQNCNNLLLSSYKMVASAKEQQTNIIQVVIVGDDGNDKLVKIYDFQVYVWKSTDTMDQLAYNFLGDPSLGTIISYFNNIENEADITAGTKIKIPILDENSVSLQNKIYALPDKRDNYGIDIALDRNGDFAISDNDFKVVKGKENLNQSITIRLTTNSNNRIRLVSYGIRQNIGDPLAIQSYLTGSIQNTLLAEPRIASINQISFTGNGDKLSIDIDYTDINGESSIFKGEI